MNTLAIRGLWMLLGYALAVLVATTVVCIAFRLATILPRNGSFDPFYWFLRDFPILFKLGAEKTAIYGFPGWLISVIYAERNIRQSKYWFAIAGVLTAALAILIAGRFQRVFDETWLNIAILVGGFAGGLAYWALAGKVSGNWKRPAEAKP